MNYKKAYLELFNEVTDIIEKLKQAQIKAEENCVGCPNTIEILPIIKKDLESPTKK